MNPLDQLQPLIDPPPVPWWPPAPGWWLLAVLLPLAGWGLWRLLRRWLSHKPPTAPSRVRFATRAAPCCPA